MRFASGRDRFIGQGLPVAAASLGLTYPAADWPGSLVYCDDGEVRWSDGDSWRTFGQSRVVYDAAVYEVTSTAELDEVLKLVSFLVPGLVVPAINHTIVLKSGFELDRQFFLEAVDLRWVRVVAEDAIVPVAKAAITVAEGPAGFTPVWLGRNGALPRISFQMELTPAYVAGPDPLLFGVLGRACNIEIVPSVAVPMTAQAAGASGFFCGAGAFSFSVADLRGTGAVRAKFDDCARGVEVNNSRATIEGIQTKNWSAWGLGSRRNADVFVTNLGQSNDFTKVASPGVDLFVDSGGRIFIDDLSAAGGYSVTPNMALPAGSVFDRRDSRQVVARGNSANGDWTRFADGTQECWHRLLIKPASDAATGNKTVTWDYPVEFVNGSTRTAVRHTIVSTNAQLRGATTVNAQGNTSVSLIYHEAGGTASDVFTVAHAIGRWI